MAVRADKVTRLQDRPHVNLSTRLQVLLYTNAITPGDAGKCRMCLRRQLRSAGKATR